ncbi:MAG: hypothetical protein DWQ10_12655 [Calditrichaeota bacterium]|nr:MAG: hypothetical protein DWQ10_12655 [Calditrichota bacterium]
MKAVIVAAGMSSRLSDTTNDTPKTLLPFEDKTILYKILSNLSTAGVDEFIIVTGYKSELIENYLKANRNHGYDITLVYNPDFRRANGISVLAAENAVNGEPFILSMSDHIVTVGAIEKTINSSSDKNLLLVDEKVDAVFDIDDATKVDVKQNKIINIGKEIDQYNAIDCGIFRLNSRYFDAMRQKLQHGEESISAAINGLIRNDDMEAVFMDSKDYWIDIDTNDAYNYASESLQDTPALAATR